MKRIKVFFLQSEQKEQMERKKLKGKELEALLSVASAEPDGLPGDVAARATAAGLAGFDAWGHRRQRNDLRRRCLAAAVVSLLLCSFAPATAPEAARTSMVVNNGTPRAQVIEGVRQILEHKL